MNDDGIRDPESMETSTIRLLGVVVGEVPLARRRRVGNWRASELDRQLCGRELHRRTVELAARDMGEGALIVRNELDVPARVLAIRPVQEYKLPQLVVCCRLGGDACLAGNGASRSVAAEAAVECLDAALGDDNLPRTWENDGVAVASGQSDEPLTIARSDNLAGGIQSKANLGTVLDAGLPDVQDAAAEVWGAGERVDAGGEGCGGEKSRETHV